MRRFKYFLMMFLVGYFKKSIVSDNLSMFIDAVFASPGNYGAGDAAFATVLYSIQIYCDFSGYTDMAIAMAGMLGYRLTPNFWRALSGDGSIDFWRRWHISRCRCCCGTISISRSAATGAARLFQARKS